MAAKPKPLDVLAFNCSLKSAAGKETSSTDVLLRQLMDELKKHGAAGEIIRAVDHDIKPGVLSDQGKGDAWRNCADAWLPPTSSSLGKRVLERMDALLDETDDRGRMPSYGKIGIVAVVGNEDGAHHCAAEIIQAMTEVGFTCPAGGVTYWVGEAQGDKEYKDLRKPPKVIADTTAMLALASNAAHLARLLKAETYPGIKE